MTLARWRRPKAPPRGALGEYAESPRSDLRSTASQIAMRLLISAARERGDFAIICTP